ncbi:MAG: GNAT family N-acetyltransferase, partial [Lewinella sp.]|nr:GNAT family N-acetyltransferase [Lewinella sp.]
MEIEEKTVSKVELRNLEMADYLQLKEAMIQAYSGMEGAHWHEDHIQKLLDIFPEGQLCILVNGQVVGSALAIIIDYEEFGNNHTYKQITGNYSFETHDEEGDVLYGIDVFIHPDYRGLRLGRRLYDARKELCESLNLRAIIFGGRIPKYKDYAKELSPKEYIEKVRLREIYDPTLTFQLSNGFYPIRVLKGYLPGDKESLEYAVLLQWNNIYYEPEEKKRLVNTDKTVIRLGLVQWQMRRMDDLDALCEQMEFFIDAVSDYKSDFVMFPEFFNAPLMAQYNHLPEPDAIRALAQFTEPLRQRALEMAVSYNINIILGSMPFIEDQSLLNVGYLCRRDGTWERYDKIHITPSEAKAWGMVGGDIIKVFDTDCGKI